MKKIEKLIEQLTTNPEVANDGVLGNHLLDWFFRGASLDYLRPLLLNPDERVASLGAWIASEIAEQGRPLLSVVGGLLGHPSKEVRFSLIDCILLWASPSEPQEIVKAVRLIDDPERAVRWKAMNFLYRASKHQLESALAYLETREPGQPHTLRLSWLLGAAGHDGDAIGAELQSPDARSRKYAVVAAARMILENQDPLYIAGSSDDPEVATFAKDMLYIMNDTESSSVE
jgi:hypothetical protein